MRVLPSILAGLLSVTPALATFHKDVVSRRLGSKKAFVNKERLLNDSILAKAMPLADYEAQMAGKGLPPTARRLDDAAAQNTYSFSGYSMKYAKCQPVQYFSEDAVADGMRSPMVTNDIVILRLCPQTSCSESREYGCVYNYAEYALSMNDYLQVMMEYSQQKREYTCDFCKACLNNEDEEQRKLEDGDADDGEDDADEDDADEEEEDADEEAQDDNANADAYDYENNVCGDDWDTYCYDYQYMCQDDNQNDGNDGYNEYSYDEYEEYMECTKVAYNGYSYFMKPTCNAYTGVIEFGIYFDDYCSESAASKVSLNKLGLGLSDSIFEEFYTGHCIDCSESEAAPYYNSNSAMCNELHYDSAKCTSRLMNDLFDGEEDDSIECSFIESLRFGAYDEVGQLTSTVEGSSWSYKPSSSQKAILVLSIVFSVFFVIYACYLHHAMTNLLIKSLSHRELLPPSRQRNRQSPKGRRGRNKVADEDADWTGEAP